MGKTRDLFKKIRDIKGTFHAKIGTIKNRNGKELTEAEEIKKRWQEYTEELYKKDLHDPDNHDGTITQLEPDILKYEVKWALGNITMNKASGGDGNSRELFQTLKDNAVKVLHSCHRTGKDQFSFQSQRKAMPKNAQKLKVNPTVVSDSVITWTAACPAPLSMEFSRQTSTQLHSSHTLVK